MLTLFKTCYYHYQVHAWLNINMKLYKQLIALIVCSPFLLSCGNTDTGAKRIVLGTSNIVYIPNILQFSLPFVVQVTRDSEHPAPGAVVAITIKPVRYFKGVFSPFDSDGDGAADLWSLGLGYTASCAAEDSNNNSVLDSGEDINNNGRLEPTYPVTVDSDPSLTPTVTLGTGTIITNQDGFGYFVVTYPQSEGRWTRIEVTATAQVTGTEENEVYTLTLPGLAADLVYVPTNPVYPPGGTTSRYGSSAVCTDDL